MDEPPYLVRCEAAGEPVVDVGDPALFLHAVLSRGWRRVALYGQGELVEIATLAAKETSIELVAVIAPGCNAPELAGLPVAADTASAPPFDAVLIADIADPQAAYDGLCRDLPDERIVIPALLHVSRDRAAGGPRGR